MSLHIDIEQDVLARFLSGLQLLVRRAVKMPVNLRPFHKLVRGGPCLRKPWATRKSNPGRASPSPAARAWCKKPRSTRPGEAAISRLIRVDFPAPEGAEITMMLPRAAGVLRFLATLRPVTSDECRVDQNREGNDARRRAARSCYRLPSSPSTRHRTSDFHSIFCACSRSFSISVFISIACRVISRPTSGTSVVLESRVLASRFIS